MAKKTPRILLAGCWVLLIPLAVCGPASGFQKPHVVIILADDMGFGDCSANNPGSKIRTVGIDRLAREGLRFTDAHSGGSSCIPSRYALLTGRFAARASLNLAAGPLIEPQRLTVPSLLQGQGYATAMVGKWHLGFEPFLQNRERPADYTRPLQGGPLDCGFDSFFGMHASLDLPPYFYIRDRRPVNPPTGDVKANSSEGGAEGWNHIQGGFWRAGKIAPGFRFDQVTPRFFDEATRIIRAHPADHPRQPLFLYLALPSPHTPWLPGEDFQGKSGAGMYGDFVLQVDAGVQQILQALANAGMQEDTLLLFTSDNGPVWYEKDRARFGHDAVGGLRGMKFAAWEGGHRMPFLVRWPRRIEPGGVCDQTIVFSDLFATLADLTGAGNLPGEAAEDSVSFLPWLVESGKSPARRPPIVHDRRTIRDGDWKLILPRPGNAGARATGELYNLKTDLGEQTNRIADHPEIAEQLRTSLRSILEQSRR